MSQAADHRRRPARLGRRPACARAPAGVRAGAGARSRARRARRRRSSARTHGCATASTRCSHEPMPQRLDRRGARPRATRAAHARLAGIAAASPRCWSSALRPAGMRATRCSSAPERRRRSRARRRSRTRSTRPTPTGRSKSGRRRKSGSSRGCRSGSEFAVHAPDLNSVGYALVGGRLVAGNEKPTALFMYENADKQRLTLQARKQPAGTERSRVPLCDRGRRRRVLLDRRPVRLRAVGHARSRAVAGDRPPRLRAARNGRRAEVARRSAAGAYNPCGRAAQRTPPRAGSLAAGATDRDRDTSSRPKFIVLYVFVASALFVHLRGRVRHKLTKQLADHSTIMAPYNALMYLFSAVPAKPILDPRSAAGARRAARQLAARSATRRCRCSTRATSARRPGTTTSASTRSSRTAGSAST